MSEISMSTRAPGDLPSASLPVEAATSHEQLSAYYLELERLLDRIERATTYYQLFGIERSATYDQVKLAYGQTISMLFPSYDVGAAVPVEMIRRMEKAFNNATLAFKVLANFNRRREYDNLSQPRAVLKPPPFAGVQMPPAKEAKKTGPAVPPGGEGVIDINRVAQQREVFTQYAKSSIAENRRRTERFRLSIPVRATGYDRKGGKWNEIGQTIDVSMTGINLRMHKRVRSGTVLYLTLPLPVKLRSHGYSDSTYNVYAIVRRVDPPRRNERFVGLEFIGEHPPTGYLENPWAVFRTAKWSGHERRRAPRSVKRQAVLGRIPRREQEASGKGRGPDRKRESARRANSSEDRSAGA